MSLGEGVHGDDTTTSGRHRVLGLGLAGVDFIAMVDRYPASIAGRNVESRLDGETEGNPVALGSVTISKIGLGRTQDVNRRACTPSAP